MTASARPPHHPPDGPPPRLDWRTRAACRDLDTEFFFPIGTSGPAVDQAEQAKAVCARCEVSCQCLAWALTTRQDAGIWGGRTEDERRKLRRSQGWR